MDKESPKGLGQVKTFRSQFAGQVKELDGKVGLASHEVEKLRVEWLGRKGKVGQLFGQLAKLDPDQKAVFGSEINQFKAEVSAAISSLMEQARQHQLQSLLSAPAEDVTLPVSCLAGSLHPVTQIKHRAEAIFRKLGYQVFDGPQLELDYYNFQALNIPLHHPARDMQDSFYVETCHESVSGSWILRTQTSNVQIHVMETHQPPIGIVAPGQVFRVDNDPTHTPLFHQIEGLYVDESVSVGDLKGTIETFLTELLGGKVRSRLRPSYFPFVEPGLEVDIALDGQNWLEVGGCGMVHPNVIEMAQYDSEKLTGFAFGFGLDRLAMVGYGLDDLRQMFSGDVPWLSQFSSYLSPRFIK